MLCDEESWLRMNAGERGVVRAGRNLDDESVEYEYGELSAE